MRGSHWIKPELVAEVAFTEFTREGTLRHPSFIALRSDKKAADVVREVAEKLPAKAKAATALSTAATFNARITNPDRLIFPESRLSKLDLADYYAAVEPIFLIDGAKRPMTLVRCPQGPRQGVLFPEA